MTSTGLGILLTLLEGLRIDIAQTWENLNKPPVGFGKNELIDMITTE